MTTPRQPITPSHLVSMATAAGIVTDHGYQWLPAHRLLHVYHPTVEVELPLLITGIRGRAELLRLVQTLANAYPPEHLILLFPSLPSTAAQTSSISAVLENGTAENTDQSDFAMIEALCVPPLAEGSSFSALQAIVAHLRSPVGCPWDREQTLLTMRHDLLSECVEVLEAIDHELDGTDNGEHIAEELGDLFMAGVLILQIAIDAGRFRLADAMQSIVTKLVRRHPHVFGDTKVDGVDAIWANWDAIKAQEKIAKGQVVDHPLDGVPSALPALEKARELQSKAQKANLLDRAALANECAAQWTTFQQHRQADTLNEQQLGEFLWTLVAAAHRAGLNAEDALRGYAVRYKNQQTP